MIEIIPALEAHLPSLSHLWRERQVILGQIDPRLDVHAAQAEQWLLQARRKLTEDRYCILVGQQDNAPVGYIVGVMAALDGENVGIIEELVLDAHRYHGGLGRSLTDGVRTWFAQRAAQRMVVRAARLLAVEQAFWRALGAQDATNWLTERMDETWHNSPEIMWMTL